MAESLVFQKFNNRPLARAQSSGYADNYHGLGCLFRRRITLLIILIAKRIVAKIKNSHISQMVILIISPTKNRARKTMIKVSRIPIGVARERVGRDSRRLPAARSDHRLAVQLANYSLNIAPAFDSLRKPINWLASSF